MQFQSLCWDDSLNEGMATRSSILAWRIPCTEELGGLQSVGLPRVGHDWSDLACTRSIKIQRHHFVHKGLSNQSYDFSSSHVWMWGCFWIVVLEKILESHLDNEIKSVNPKGNQSCIFMRRTDAEVEAPLLSQLMRRADSLEKTLMLRKFEGRRRGWQRTKSLDGIPDLIDMSLSKLWEMIEQGRLACCSP